MTYHLGESAGETQRLVRQAGHDDALERARWAGLRPGMTVVDAGCGPGAVAAQLARVAGPAGRVLAFDRSAARLAAARERTQGGGAPVELLRGDVLAPPLAPRSADFVLCQYVFEYLREPAPAARALAGLLRPGGRLLLVDADDVAVNCWPIPEDLDAQMRRVLGALAAAGFDARAGRKLYAFAREAGLRDVEVRLDARTFAGAAPPDEQEAWRQRLAALEPAGAAALGGPDAWRTFAARYRALLADEGVFKYTVIVSVHGVRP